MTFNCKMLVAALATVATLATATSVSHAQATGTVPGGAPSQGDRMAGAKASLKARFGFTDAQATTVIQKMQATLKSYQPKMMALQKKYGASPTPEQRQKMQREAIPLISEISKKSNAILLSVATKEQRPKIMAQMKAEQEQIAKMKNQ